MKVFDGHIYEDDAVLPDLGSLECVGFEGRKRFYTGLSADVDKLPTYDDLATDSTAKFLDTGDFYYYKASTKTWYKQ